MRLLLLLFALSVTAPAAAAPGGTIVAFGDSITTDQHAASWPEALGERLHQRFPDAAVTIVNAGIGGDQLLWGVPVIPAGVERFAQDALGQQDVRIVIVLEGINDIGAIDLAGAGIKPDPAERKGAPAIIEGYKSLIAQAHAQGVRIYGGTLTPFAGTTFAGYYSAAGEAIRQAVNHWIRTSGAFDAVIDFDAAIRDPANPDRMRPAYDSGDHLHPSSAGEAAMAAAIDLDLLQ